MMYLLDPSPSPSVSYVDPFGPWPVEKYPPAPEWLLPVVLIIFLVACLVIVVLLVMWGIARRKSAAALAAGRGVTSTWVNLKDFDPKADPRRPKSPQVVREDDVNRKGKKKKS
jgi:lipopolysaccharide export LptBFGC system permease protein LptF